ncbi:MAG: FtsX-like permease family protein, partial [Proteobacteria bacterium]
MNRALIKHFLRSFRNRKSWMALYLSSSVFGIAGLFLLFTLKSGIDGSLQERSQLFLTADLSVSARRLFTDEEKLTLADSLKDFATESTRVLDLLSMIRVGQDRSRLIELVGVEKAYPLYGKIETETNTPVSQVGDAQMVVDSDLRDQLGLQVGSQARVGDLAWKVSGVIKEDTSSVWKGLTFAPTAYVSASYLRQSDLLKKGSTLTERFYYRLKDSDQAESVAKLVRKAIPDSGVRVTSHIQSNEQITRSLDYLSDYLGLLGTVSFLLAFVGTLYLVQTERKRVRFEMAILRSLGLTPGSVLKLLWIESAGLSLLMTLIAWVVVRLISQPLLTWIGGQIGVSIRTETSVLVLGVAFLFSFVTYGLSTLLLLRGELKFPLRSLLSGGNDQDQAARPGLFEIAVAALFVLALSMAVSHSYRLGIAFSIGLWFAAAVIAGVFVLINRILPKQLNERGAFRLIALHLSRNPLSQGIAFG